MTKTSAKPKPNLPKLNFSDEKYEPQPLVDKKVLLKARNLKQKEAF
jgi:hypothetical protein